MVNMSTYPIHPRTLKSAYITSMVNINDHESL